MSGDQRPLPIEPPGSYIGPKEQVFGPNGSRTCQLCDEYGWVLDPEDQLGWAVKCRHDPHQLLPVKPADTHAAARMMRDGRRREEAQPGFYQRADPSRTRWSRS